MWICLNDAFISVVSKGEDKSQLCVRARRRSHLQVLFPDAEIIEGAGTDYAYRIFVDRKEVARVIGRRLADISYDNFKDSVGNYDLKRAYGKVWMIMSELQDD